MFAIRSNERYANSVVPGTPEPQINEPSLEVGETRELQEPWTLGKKMKAIYDSRTGKPMDIRLKEERAVVGASEAIGSEGGFLVGTQESTTIMKKTFEQGDLLPRVSKMTIGAGFNGVDWTEPKENNRKDTYRHGGILGYWTAEAGTVNATDIEWEKKSLDLEEITALMPATNRLLEDTTALESKAMTFVPKELAFQANRGIVAGTGAGMPLGTQNSAATISVAAETSQLADTILYENIKSMRCRILDSSLSGKNLVWMYNSDTLSQLLDMVKTVGASGHLVWMPAGGVSGLPYDTLYGKPAFSNPFCKTLGDKFDIMLVDLDEYLWIDKGGVKSDVSIYVYFTTNQTLFRFVYRANGMPIRDSAVTAYEGTQTYSPFVTLDART